MIGDIRLEHRAEALLDGIVSTGSLVLRKFGGDRAGEVSAHRFLGNDRVGPEMIFADARERCIAACGQRRVVVVQDTTEVNFAGRSAARWGLGPGGNGVSPGFFIHSVIAVDEASGSVTGHLGAQIWTRSGKIEEHRRDRLFEDKESIRWLDGAELAAQSLMRAERVTVVCDREADIYQLFARCPERVELVVRVAHNRRQAGDGPHVFSAQPAGLGETMVDIKAQPGRKARKAHVELRAGRVSLARPKNGADEGDVASLDLSLVEVVELNAPLGAGKPLHWRLYTTLPVDDVDAVHEVIRLYRLRWRIEEVFRVLKSDGLKLEDTQLHGATSVMNLAALGTVAAVRILQLVNARDGSERPASDVLEATLQPAVEPISRSLEGRTERQKNPHPPGSLAWLSWVCARLGGWNCYYGPPGPKTMAAGWQRLSQMIAGYEIARNESLV